MVPRPESAMATTDSKLPEFHGEFFFGIDGSRRVMIPAKWRPKDPGVEFHVILWPIQTKEYLLVLPPERWQLLLERLKGNSINNRGLAAYEREIARSSAVLELDKVGRFCLPENLAEQAGINGEAFFVGRLNKFEIWNPKRAKAAAAADVALVNEIAGSIEL